jgi:outer membrane immunogenic protein
MKYLLAGTIALFAFASVNAARAADMPLKAPVPIAPAPSWTGFYLGAQLGAAWQDAHTDYGPVAAPFAPVIIFGFANGLIPTSARQDGTGFLGGLTLGYNMQSGPVVWGLEGDASWLSVRNTSNVTGATVVGIGFTDTTTTETKTDWLATLRPRAGFLVSPQSLLYATGGLAVGHVSGSTTFTPGGATTCATNILCSAGSGSATRVGWTAGAGFEYAFMPGWSAKIEYLYYDLGSFSYGINEISPGAAPGAAGSPNATATTKVTGNIARLGVNMKF